MRRDLGPVRLAFALACALACALVTRTASATELSARLSERTVDQGGTVTLIITVTDPRGPVLDPQMMLPSSFELLGTARAQGSALRPACP
jgi:hypothetical protein